MQFVNGKEVAPERYRVHGLLPGVLYEFMVMSKNSVAWSKPGKFRDVRPSISTMYLRSRPAYSGVHLLRSDAFLELTLV